jgi:membrane protein
VDFLSPLFARIINILPYFIIVLVLTLLYLFMPNTRVKFFNALIAALVAGTALQVFQFLYLSGQIWITKYNAIYGTFAAIPLLLLWIQLSWFIILIGVELSFAAQNVGKFNFDKETRNISRRYRDFFTLLIMTEIVKSFMDDKPALTNDEISEACSVPIGLTNRIIDDLQDMKMICPTPSEKEPKVMAYVPALDINLITVNYLMKKIDQFGSEDFRVDNKVAFYNEWNALMETRKGFYENNRTVLLKDL